MYPVKIFCFELKQVGCRAVMPIFPTRTGKINHISGVYSSNCHNAERTILEGQQFPRCAYCNADTVWVFEQSVKPVQSAGNWKEMTMCACNVNRAAATSWSITSVMVYSPLSKSSFGRVRTFLRSSRSAAKYYALRWGYRLNAAHQHFQGPGRGWIRSEVDEV
jgi:hypothetical protein